MVCFTFILGSIFLLCATMSFCVEVVVVNWYQRKQQVSFGLCSKEEIYEVYLFVFVVWILMLVLCTYVVSIIMHACTLHSVLACYMVVFTCRVLFHVFMFLYRFHPNCHYHYCKPFKPCREQWAVLWCWSGMLISRSCALLDRWYCAS